MESSHNQKTEKERKDILYCLNDLKCATLRLQLDFNREPRVYHFCEKTLSRLGLVEKLIQKGKLQLPILISSKVNELFELDKNLSIVNCQIINSKRTFNPTAIGQIKI